MHLTEAGEQGSGCPSVLLVEGDDFIRGTVGEFLIRQGYLVIAARDAGEALRLARQARHVDALVTDIAIPGMSGRQLARRIANVVAPSRVLYISGFTGDLLFHPAPLDGPSTLVHNPFSFRALTERLRELLARPER